MFNNIRNRFPYAEINVVPTPGGYGYQVYKDKLNEVGCLGGNNFAENCYSISSVAEDHPRGPQYHTCQNPNNRW